MEIFDGPAVVTHPDRHYLGIRVITPFRGMFAVRDQLMKELYTRPDLSAGLTFFRLHEIDMDGPMDIEVGVVTQSRLAGDERIRPGVLPAGRYAAMTYSGHGRRANGTLLDWAHDEGLALDRAGDRFGCRYEAYLTDPRTERMKTRWRIELAIRLA
ncbi:GyrI-like domain-containing protein [Paractinoplanes durhamensis]|uniref:DNA gyrase inhibitor n=1 Tax=Paractinoplanes durhamensis TaxID=113563 RepID=A0ABQ3YR41_9ACTN|nr:GyrI-like domain-containing protein [Actinoplanes durhamensis]GIE00056.1 DNA gyrase inhibitor [Actinoplanes durhamensis]